MTTEQDMKPLIEAKLSEIQFIDQALHARIAELQSALKDLEGIKPPAGLPYPNTYTFTTPLLVEGMFWGWLKTKILEPLEAKRQIKHVVEYTNKGQAIKKLSWTECDEKHRRDIEGACRWAESHEKAKLEEQEAIAKI